jgi:cytochrome c-type biogenesis protein CcmH/NrfF
MNAATLPLPLAHVGHWSIYILYAVPVVVVLVSVVVTVRRERRAAQEGPSDAQES